MRLKRMQAPRVRGRPPSGYLFAPRALQPKQWGALRSNPFAPRMPRGHLWGQDSALPSRRPPLHFARPPTPGANSWPGATLAIQGGIEGERRPPTPPPGVKPQARRGGEEKAPAARHFTAVRLYVGISDWI